MRWRWLPWLAVATLGVSLLLSPVPRAGAAAVAATPLLLLVPAGASRLVGGQSRREALTTALLVVLLLVSLRALLGVTLEGHSRAALPLGHHNLLAVWLLGLLPLAATRALVRPPGRVARLLATLSLAVGGAALLATGSLSGALGGTVELAAGALFWCGRRRHSRRWPSVLVGLALLLVLLQLPRLTAIVQARDTSVAARAAYLEAGLEGWRERPWLGQGPGATAWTVARFFDPVAGIHPPGQVLSDLHSVPIQVLYELGLVGSLPIALIALIWLRRRVTGRARLRGRPVRLAALVGLLGMATASITSGLFGTSASPVLALVLAGLATAKGRRSAEPVPMPGRSWLATVSVLALASAQVPPLLALREHAAARRDGEQRIDRLERALRWDDHPLYAAQQAWWRAEEGLVDERTWRIATEAAHRSSDVGVLWLSAGSIGLGLDELEAREQLVRACRLDPFGAFAPFLLAVSDPRDELAALRLARALLLEPRLLAAPELQREVRLRTEAVREVLAWPGVPPGWREALADAAAAASTESDPEELQDLALVVDRRPATSLSLFTFRRQPLPTPVLRVAVDARVAAAIELVPASTLPALGEALSRRGCD